MSRFVNAESGAPIVVDRLLGQGGQGEVYQAIHQGAPYALKLYHAQMATPEQRRSIGRLVAKGCPAPYFLWPEHVVEDRHEPRFGYLMPLREPRFHSTEDLMARRVHATFRSLVDASIQLADAFLKLHALGLCYRDISFGNVFLDPATGDVRICDNDNVDLTGARDASVLGTPRFMAPEVVRGEAAPSDMTDRYSLAVLLFYLLMGGHPLDGQREANIRCLDLPAMNRLYGTQPLYVFDPRDAGNRPVPGQHDNVLVFRDVYPRALLDAFERSFTEGLSEPANRIRESEWRKLFGRLRDLLLHCADCGAQAFHDPAAPAGRACWKCRRSLCRPALLHLNGAPVVLQPGVHLYPHHLSRVPFDYARPLAEVTRHPTSPALLGLKNLGSDPWTFTRPDGTTADVPPGRTAPLVAGNRLHFGPTDGEVAAGG